MKVDTEHLADAATYAKLINKTTQRAYQLFNESEMNNGPLTIILICGKQYAVLTDDKDIKRLNKINTKWK